MRILRAGLLAVLLTASCSTPKQQYPRLIPDLGTVHGELQQVADVPEKWEYRPIEFPDAATTLKNAKPNPHIYGLYTWTGEYKTHHESIRRVGWKSFRAGGPFDDEAMKLYITDDVEIMPTPTPSKDGPKYDKTNPGPYINAYAQKVTALTERYGPDGNFFKDNPSLPNRPMRHIEICNEPNFQYLIPPDGRPQKELEADREALYAKLLPAAYAAIKSKSPEMKVIGFAAGGAGAGDMRFIQHVHEKNPAVAKSYDVLSTHPYVDPAPPEAWAIRSWGGYSIPTSLKSIRKILEPHARSDAPIWYTEIGWPISQADGGRFPTKGKQVSPMLQAAYVCRLYALAQRLGVERVHIMFATDTDNFNAGFFTKDGKWRPSAHAVQNMIKLMPAPRLAQIISDGADGTFAYRFAPGNNGRAVTMVWNVNGPKEVDISLISDGQVRLVDMLGTSKTLTQPREDKESIGDYLNLRNRGQLLKIRIEAGPYPVYLVED